jgi:F-type H+-transporting ATPase subunit a
MGPLILAIECDPTRPIMCVPPSVNTLFETQTVFSIGSFGVNRAMLLMFLAALLTIALLVVGYGRVRLVPTKVGAAIEAVVGFVHDQVAIGVIGPEGARYFPYLLGLFLFLLISNLFEVLPFINFPVTARMALPFFLAVVTWFLFVIVGIVRNGFGYLLSVVWPRGAPLAVCPLIGFIEFLSTFILRPFTLAVRLFANMVAGHLLLTLLLVSGVVFIPELSAKSILGVAWFAFGTGIIFPFEIFVGVLQAYVFTLLTAVYIETSLHIEH